VAGTTHDHVEARSARPGVVPPTAEQRRAFLAVALAAVLLTVALVVVLSMLRNDGHLVYAMDDAGIHLSMVRQLVHHGTWGVSSGTYESASSSPGWTLLLAGSTAVLPFAANVLPLLLNLVAAVWIVWLFASGQTFVTPRARQWLSIALAVFIPAVVLFLPTLAMVGMEHTLHAALVLQALVLLQRLAEGPLQVRRARWYLLVLFLATLVRYETMWIAAGSALALLVTAHPRFGPVGAPPRRLRGAVGLATLSAVACALPIVTYGVINRIAGQGFFPNSVTAKSALAGNRGLSIVPNVSQVLGGLQRDPVILLLVLVAAGYLVTSWFGGPRANVSFAVAFVVAAALHAGFSEFGYYERYQAYLVIAGTFMALRIGSEVVIPRWHRAALVFLLVAVVGLTSVKQGLLVDTPLATSNTYRQRYQLGRFFEKYYKGKVVGTGELGYVTYFHDGPVVDLLGLGTHEVLVERRKGPLTKRYLAELVRRRHVAVIGIYTETFIFHVPADWVLVGEWTLKEKLTSAFGPTLQFYAPSKSSADKLERNLRAFDPQLPSGVRATHRNELVRRFLKSVAQTG